VCGSNDDLTAVVDPSIPTYGLIEDHLTAGRVLAARRGLLDERIDASIRGSWARALELNVNTQITQLKFRSVHAKACGALDACRDLLGKAERLRYDLQQALVQLH